MSPNEVLPSTHLVEDEKFLPGQPLRWIVRGLSRQNVQELVNVDRPFELLCAFCLYAGVQAFSSSWAVGLLADNAWL